MCCPHYTLRLDSTSFQATRDQRQAVNRFTRYVIGDAYAKEAARLCPRSKEEAKRRETIFDLAERIHEAEINRLPPLSLRQLVSKGQAQQAEKVPKEHADDHTSPLAESTMPDHRFEVTLEPDTFTEEKYLVYENYQRIVHKEPPSKITRQGFASFLCNSPLRRETLTDSSGHTRELGSFHQCYRLDGRLVAIGVLDLLPNSLSAVYFLYHESIHQHNPGKLGALREIALAREHGYRWWYSGFYIHSCPKMRYKIDYAPQYVLDPETLDWDLLDKESLALFDKFPYVSLSRERRRAGCGGKNGRPASEYTTAYRKAAGGDRQDDCNSNDKTSDDLDYEDGQDSASDESESDHPLFMSNMPGLPPLDTVAGLALGEIPIQTNMHSDIFPIRFLVVWSEGTVLDGTSFKSKVAELVAAMGPDLITRICLDFRRHRKPEY
ncbi:arginine-tRNA-protein transferase 1 [Grosmannia clavigera kw1407]|uniref:Arginine-tRNA-protein transferase 1 n=1 Tax=Grosmannia clavigera (strain kw1407 / UAMH 11150) TaxID=655863 RepID=F0XD73_GROCL|nr:arginine-tRNA-protein transferase 1 [Grosmannia clavigera kw1407]EFX04553.1 arginine-tRNA-protein transferase 1 [Grosmannia clavigera kw1407]